MINKGSKLYDKLLNIYKTQYDNLSEDQKMNVLNRPENLILVLPPMPKLEGDEEVKFEPEETIAAKVKLNPRKKKQEQD